MPAVLKASLLTPDCLLSPGNDVGDADLNDLLAPRTPVLLCRRGDVADIEDMATGAGLSPHSPGHPVNIERDMTSVIGPLARLSSHQNNRSSTLSVPFIAP